jgi:hypothetical protein
MEDEELNEELECEPECCEACMADCEFDGIQYEFDYYVKDGVAYCSHCEAYI